MTDKYGLKSIPRRWCSDKVLSVIVFLLGNKAPSRRPLRYLIFHELTAREHMELAECEDILTWKAKVEEIRSRLKW